MKNINVIEQVETKSSTDTQMNMKDFLEKFSEPIKDRVRSALQPVYQKSARDGWDKTMADKLLNLKRRPFSAQTDTILSIAKGLFKADKKSAILVGEMGTGKTLMGTAISTLIPKKNCRIMIMCPSHLVVKWAREIRETDPVARDVRIIKQIKNIPLVKPHGREYWIISKEKAKLHYSERMSLSLSVSPKRNIPTCPDCGQLIDDLSLRVCKKCGSKLYSADNKGFRRYAIAEYIKRHKKMCRLDLLILDEVHELKSGDSAQGAAMHALAVTSDKILALTGTLMGGYASNLYYLLFRLFTREMVALGYKHNSSINFSKQYGVVEERYESFADSCRTASMGKDNSVRQVQEKPGISPLLLPHFLLENSVYLWISDISSQLPTYSEEVEQVEMTDVQKIIYKGFEKELAFHVTEALKHKDKRLLGALVNSLYALPDGARRGEFVIDPDTKEAEHPWMLCQAEPLDIPMLPKEKRLIELVTREKRLGRKCAIFLEHTGTRDLIPDIAERLEEYGIKPLILRSETTVTSNREEWIKKAIKTSSPDVLICNPNLVKTGLDLLEFPTIIYFQTGMSIYTLRQSSRRSWRIGQKQQVKVYFMAYADTAQERALKLIATKLETSNAVEGKLSADGLSAMSDGDASFVLELARSIMGEDTDKRNFNDVWAGYKKSEEMIETSLTVSAEICEEKELDTFKERPAVSPAPSERTLSAIMQFASAKKPNIIGRQAQLSVFDLLESMEELETAI